MVLWCAQEENHTSRLGATTGVRRDHVDPLRHHRRVEAMQSNGNLSCWWRYLEEARWADLE